MRLLFVVSHYYPYTGGVEYVVKSVAERLARRGHDVTVLCGESNIEKSREELVNSVHVVRWPVCAPGDAYYIPRMRHRLTDWLLSAVKDCDVVHFHNVHSVLAVYSLKVLKGSRVRKVLTPYYHDAGHTFLGGFCGGLALPC
ncbi:MAG: glycosyltransferase family 4 protein [Candidatus Bathyarchaeia archaeon]